MADVVPPSQGPDDAPVESPLAPVHPTVVKLFTGQAFLPDGAGSLLRNRRTTVVVLAGPANSGKSTLLTRIYHQFQQGPIDTMSFAGSQNLVELERRSFKSRIESGRLMSDTERQKLPEGQTLIHLAVTSENERHDLLIGDMAGEHFDDVADFAGEVPKQPTLSRADAIVLVLDGEQCSGAARWNVVARVEMLLKSLRDSHLVEASKLQLLITKWDVVAAAGDEAIEAATDAQRQIGQLIGSMGGSPVTFKTAARGSNPLVPPGYGIPELLRSWLKPRPRRIELPHPEPALKPSDMFR